MAVIQMRLGTFPEFKPGYPINSLCMCILVLSFHQSDNTVDTGTCLLTPAVITDDWRGIGCTSDTQRGTQVDEGGQIAFASAREAALDNRVKAGAITKSDYSHRYRLVVLNLNCQYDSLI